MEFENAIEWLVLALLGHSSIEITRIYLASARVEHARQLEWLGLIFQSKIRRNT